MKRPNSASKRPIVGIDGFADNECRNDASIKPRLGRGSTDFVEQEKVIYVVVRVGEEERSSLEKGPEEGRNRWRSSNFSGTRQGTFIF